MSVKEKLMVGVDVLLLFETSSEASAIVRNLIGGLQNYPKKKYYILLP